tara:strand:+ start:4395 stop:4772 length:378 start_codon:yes stop_codon:yes gene_type:complete
MEPTTVTPLRLLIADKSKVYMSALESLLKLNQNITIIEFCDSSFSLMNILKKSEVDILIFDPIIFNENSTSEIQNIKNQFPHLKIIALSIQESSNMRADMLKAGVFEHLSKWDDAKKIISLINYN